MVNLFLLQESSPPELPGKAESDGAFRSRDVEAHHARPPDQGQAFYQGKPLSLPFCNYLILVPPCIECVAHHFQKQKKPKRCVDLIFHPVPKFISEIGKRIEKKKGGEGGIVLFTTCETFPQDCFV